MRYLLKPPVAILSWLLKRDPDPKILPSFPEDNNKGLVVTSLIGGSVYAKVIPKPDDYAKACGDGLPLGRVYFQILKSELYMVCPALSEDAF